MAQGGRCKKYANRLRRACHQAVQRLASHSSGMESGLHYRDVGISADSIVDPAARPILV
jgi:hypothetical protein